MDGRRRQWVAKDVLFYRGDLGIAMRERFGPIGWVVFDAFLTACKRNSVQGQMSYTTDASALVGMDIPDLRLVDEAGDPWTLDEFWTFLGRRHQVRKRRRGRTTDVISTTWDKWQRTPGRAAGDDNTSTASKKTTSVSVNTTDTRQHHDTQNGRSEGRITGQLEPNTGDDSNPDPYPDPDPESDSDIDPDPDTRARESERIRASTPPGYKSGGSMAYAEGVGVGVGVGSEYTDIVLRDFVNSIEATCTGNHRPTIRNEAIQVVAVCAPQVPLDVMDEALFLLGKNPPTLPRAFFPIIESVCDKRGLRIPVLALPGIKRAV